MAARRAQRVARHGQHVHPHRIVGDDGDGVGVIEAERLGEAPDLFDRDLAAGGALPRQQVLRVLEPLDARRAAVAQHVPRDLLHAHGPSRVAHPRRHDRDGLLHRPGREDVEDEPGSVREPDRVHGSLLALRRPGVDLPVPGVVLAVRLVMLSVD